MMKGSAAMATTKAKQDQPEQGEEVVTPATVETPESAASAAKAPSASTPEEAPELGDAGKRAIKQERDAARQANADKKAAEDRLQAVLVALGMGEGEQDDPAQALEDTQKRVVQAESESAVLRAAYAAGADPEALLDSRRFTESLSALDLTDAAAVKEHVEEWVKDHPRYASQTRTGGVRDAASGRSGGRPAVEPEPGTPRLAAAFESKLKNRNR